MSGAAYRIEQRDGHEIHLSVGAIIWRDGKLLLIDRLKPPLGWAGIAGHVDAGEEPLDALKREVTEESGLQVESAKLLIDEFVDWNQCSSGVTGHHWYVYECQVSGGADIDSSEAKASYWYKPTELLGLKLEPVWKYCLGKLRIMGGGTDDH